MSTQVENFKSKVWKTKVARFNAARRMRFNHRVATLTPPLMSAYIIAINLLVFIPVFKNVQQEITVFTIALSVLTLVITHLIQNRRFDEMEKNFHQCGESMNELYDKADLLESADYKINDTLPDLQDKYHAILKEHNLNHKEIDLLRAENPKNLWYSIRWCFASSGILYLLAIILPVVIFYVLICKDLF